MATVYSEKIGGKVSKVRFAPSKNYDDTNPLFASGTWDEEEENVITLWRAKQKPPALHQVVNAFDFRILGELKQEGDVKDICFVESEFLITASSQGSIDAYRLIEIKNPIEEDTDIGTAILTEHLIEFENISSRTLHSLPTVKSIPATGLAIQPNTSDDPEIASVGEDGKLVFSRMGDGMTEIIQADAGIINGVAWPTSNEIVIGTSGGRLKKFDRRNLQSPIAKTEGTLDRCNCVAVNPNQAIQVATGSSNGFVTVWDSRNLLKPLDKLQSHKLSVWDILFHPNRAETLICCSEDGTTTVLELGQKAGESFIGNQDRTRVLPNNLNRAALNSLDYHPSAKLLTTGGDSEKLFFHVNE
ncbi:hypothetical protein G9A89_014785 [Geosiphon pyriformis]|nr:hypothetical protein G9A89_014785 [Geosiphon pyriformis]